MTEYTYRLYFHNAFEPKNVSVTARSQAEAYIVAYEMLSQEEHDALLSIVLLSEKMGASLFGTEDGPEVGLCRFFRAFPNGGKTAAWRGTPVEVFASLHEAEEAA